ncbi:MAG: T9SS type A sorting domain-containing protein [Reichenbachiella sp.]|uniref:T9SS type A sorting domain-containing protein n=1 Tax=Reichenbachiella sp. TaxID=2184521 RepID=UPI003266F66B
MAQLDRMLSFMLCMIMSTIACAQYDQNAFWSDETGIYFFDTETSLSKKVVGADPFVTGGVHVDANKTYYLSHNKSRLNVVDHDGGNPSLLVDLETIDWLQENGTTFKVMDVAYDLANGKGYFTALESHNNNYAKSTSVFSSPSVVYSFDLTTGAIDSLFAGVEYDNGTSSTRFEQVPSLTIDHTNSKLVYLIEEDVNSRVETRDLNGSNMSLVVDGFEEANWIEIDQASQTLFIMAGRRRAGFDAIYKANLDGSNFQTLFSNNIEGDEGFLITPSNLYFLDNNDVVLSSDLNGSNISNDVFVVPVLPNAIDVARDELYYVIAGELKRRVIGSPFGYTDVVTNFDRVRELQVEDLNSRLFYQDGFTSVIYSMDFDGGNHQKVYASVNPVILKDWKLDVDDNRIISLEKDESPGVNTFDLYRRPLDDPDNGSVISADIGSVNVIDIDPINDNLIMFPSQIAPSEAVYDFKNDMGYYILGSGGNHSIYITNDVTQQGTELTFFNVNDPQNLILNVHEDKIYWSNTSGSEGQYRMNLDGTNEEKIADFPVVSLAFVGKTVVNPSENTPPRFELSQTAMILEAEFESQTIEAVPQTIPDSEIDQTVIYDLSPTSIDFANVMIDKETGLITISAIGSLQGTQEFTVTANDGQVENNSHKESFTLTVKEPITLSVQNGFVGIEIFPNPATSFVKVQSQEPIESVSLVDATGKLMQSLTNIQQDQSISLEALKTGVYFISIQTDSRLVVKRLIHNNTN